MPLPEEVVDSHLERLALLRAKTRVNSWSEQAKSPWTWLGFLVGFAGFPILLMFWVGAFSPDSVVGLREAFAVTLFAAVLVCFLWLAHEAWKKKRILRYYEMELLKLRVGKPE